MPDFQEPSGEALRRQSERMRDHEEMMLRGMQAFRGVDPARQSAEPSISFSVQRNVEHNVQHWEVYGRQGGYCKVDGCSWLTFPMVFFQHDRDRVVIKFTVRFDQLREAHRWSLRLEGDDIIFGEVLAWRQQQDGIDFTLFLHSEGVEMRAQAGDLVRYSLTVPTMRYRRSEGNAYRLSLERAGLLPDRIAGLQELMQERSQPGEARLEESAQTSEQSTISALRRFHHQLERTGLTLNSAEAIEELNRSQESEQRLHNCDELTETRQELAQETVQDVFRSYDQGIVREIVRERSQPPVNKPAICQDCRNLHGQYHGGTLLVCGLHPYGNGEDCSDFEKRER